MLGQFFDMKDISAGEDFRFKFEMGLPVFSRFVNEFHLIQQFLATAGKSIVAFSSVFNESLDDLLLTLDFFLLIFIMFGLNFQFFFTFGHSLDRKSVV